MSHTNPLFDAGLFNLGKEAGQRKVPVAAMIWRVYVEQITGGVCEKLLPQSGGASPSRRFIKIWRVCTGPASMRSIVGVRSSVASFAGSIIKRRFDPKLAKPRMGLHSDACIRRLIEWCFRKDWADIEGEFQNYKTYLHSPENRSSWL
jgi:hypothetical protein